MGVVLRAKHTELGSLVALKLLAQQDPTPEAIARFRREARVLAQIKHPNVVGISDLGEERGIAFLAMELIEGPSLQTYITQHFERGEQPDFRRVAEITLAIGRALAHCHGDGVIHRDVKPHNILIEVETGRPVLTDFGLVKREKSGQGQSSSITGALEGQILGTPSYMSPEQFEPGGEFGEVGPKSDVYGLGAVLHYSLTGQPPFAARNLVDLYGQVTSEPPNPPSELCAEVPPALDALTLTCLRKPVAERIELADFLTRLEGLLASKRLLRARGSGASRVGLIVLLLLGLVVLDLTVIQPDQGRRLVRLIQGGPPPSPSVSAAPSDGSELSPAEAEAALERAKELLGQKPPATAEALGLLERSGEAGVAAAWVWLGQLYVEGQKVPKDEARGVELFKRGAKGKNPTAMLWLGVLARDGRGQPQDSAVAQGWFERATTAGGPEHEAVRAKARRLADELRQARPKASPAERKRSSRAAKTGPQGTAPAKTAAEKTGPRSER
jgi:serine/threonine protein kinase